MATGGRYKPYLTAPEPETPLESTPLTEYPPTAPLQLLSTVGQNAASAGEKAAFSAGWRGLSLVGATVAATAFAVSVISIVYVVAYNGAFDNVPSGALLFRSASNSSVLGGTLRATLTENGTLASNTGYFQKLYINNRLVTIGNGSIDLGGSVIGPISSTPGKGVRWSSSDGVYIDEAPYFVDDNGVFTNVTSIYSSQGFYEGGVKRGDVFSLATSGPSLSGKFAVFPSTDSKQISTALGISSQPGGVILIDSLAVANAINANGTANFQTVNAQNVTTLGLNARGQSQFETIDAMNIFVNGTRLGTGFGNLSTITGATPFKLPVYLSNSTVGPSNITLVGANSLENIGVVSAQTVQATEIFVNGSRVGTGNATVSAGISPLKLITIVNGNEIISTNISVVGAGSLSGVNVVEVQTVNAQTITANSVTVNGTAVGFGNASFVGPELSNAVVVSDGSNGKVKASQVLINASNSISGIQSLQAQSVFVNGENVSQIFMRRPTGELIPSASVLAALNNASGQYELYPTMALVFPNGTIRVFRLDIESGGTVAGEPIGTLKAPVGPIDDNTVLVNSNGDRYSSKGSSMKIFPNGTVTGVSSLYAEDIFLFVNGQWVSFFTLIQNISNPNSTIFGNMFGPSVAVDTFSIATYATSRNLAGTTVRAFPNGTMDRILDLFAQSIITSAISTPGGVLQVTAANTTFSGALRAQSVATATIESTAPTLVILAANTSFTGPVTAPIASTSRIESLSSTLTVLAAKTEFSGAVDATSGNFSGAVDATSGSFSGAVNAASGNFSGAVSAASGTFNGPVTATTGTFDSVVTDTINGTLNVFPDSGVMTIQGVGENKLILRGESTDNVITMSADDSSAPGYSYIDFNGRRPGGGPPLNPSKATFTLYSDQSGSISDVGLLYQVGVSALPLLRYAPADSTFLQLRQSSMPQIRVPIIDSLGNISINPLVAVTLNNKNLENVNALTAASGTFSGTVSATVGAFGSITANAIAPPSGTLTVAGILQLNTPGVSEVFLTSTSASRFRWTNGIRNGTGSGNIDLQIFNSLGPRQGWSVLAWNGYWNAGIQRYDTTKYSYQMIVDQSPTDDNWSLRSFSPTESTHILVQPAAYPGVIAPNGISASEVLTPTVRSTGNLSLNPGGTAVTLNNKAIIDLATLNTSTSTDFQLNLGTDQTIIRGTGANRLLFQGASGNGNSRIVIQASNSQPGNTAIIFNGPAADGSVVDNSKFRYFIEADQTIGFDQFQIRARQGVAEYLLLSFDPLSSLTMASSVPFSSPTLFAANSVTTPLVNTLSGDLSLNPAGSNVNFNSKNVTNINTLSLSRIVSALGDISILPAGSNIRVTGKNIIGATNIGTQGITGAPSVGVLLGGGGAFTLQSFDGVTTVDYLSATGGTLFVNVNMDLGGTTTLSPTGIATPTLTATTITSPGILSINPGGASVTFNTKLLTDIASVSTPILTSPSSLTYNVPTIGDSHAFSVNSVPRLSVTTSTVTLASGVSLTTSANNLVLNPAGASIDMSTKSLIQVGSIDASSSTADFTFRTVGAPDNSLRVWNNVVGAGASNVRIQSLLQAPGLMYLAFNGGFSGTEFADNTAKRRWRFGADQRSTTDQIFLEGWISNTPTNYMVLAPGTTPRVQFPLGIRPTVVDIPYGCFNGQQITRNTPGNTAVVCGSTAGSSTMPAGLMNRAGAYFRLQSAWQLTNMANSATSSVVLVALVGSGGITLGVFPASSTFGAGFVQTETFCYYVSSTTVTCTWFMTVNAGGTTTYSGTGNVSTLNLAIDQALSLQLNQNLTPTGNTDIRLINYTMERM